MAFNFSTYVEVPTAVNSQRLRTSSLRSFYSAYDDSLSESNEYEFGAVMHDYPKNSHGKPNMPLSKWNSESELTKSVQRKIKQIAVREKKMGETSRANSVLPEDDIEVPRGAPVQQNRIRKPEALDYLIREPEVPRQGTDLVTSKIQQKQLRMKIFATRTAMHVEPKLVERTRTQVAGEEEELAVDGQDPAREIQIVLNHGVECQNDRARVKQQEAVTSRAMNNLVGMCSNDATLTENILFNPRFDSKWKWKHTKTFARTDSNGKKTKRNINSQGWVAPLKEMCAKFNINSSFFTNQRMELKTARDQVMLLRLSMPIESSTSWCASRNPEILKNGVLSHFLEHDFDPNTMGQRVQAYKATMIADKDEIRVSGQYYNNISIGKRMFGAARKQKVVSTIIGGMERRFEILDNSVNHIPFTHAVSDENVDKLRNPRVRCKDETRVALNFPSGATNDFIHANRVSAGPLFNEFIVTQAPMNNTIDAFWRMVWQEKCPYIVMLVSRKNESRCANYWPRYPSKDALSISGGLIIENCGVHSSPDPLFRVTNIKITGPFGEELLVEHWQAEMNNSSNLMSPLNVLRMLRNSSRPVVVHDCLGISRAACLVAAEIAICNMIKGPVYKYPVQKAVQFLRMHRPFSIETPMQYIFVHRVVNYFFRDFIGNIREVDSDYERWLEDRSNRLFLDDLTNPIPGYRLLSPVVDPDLLCLVGRPERPNRRREAPDCVGELPYVCPPGESVETPARKTLFQS